jgi:hypothetical protein
MLATFCVRLALGIILFLPLIWNCLPHARFVRTQFLTALGLLVVASVSGWYEAENWLRCLLLIGAGVSLAGALAWTFQPAPAGKTVILGGLVILTALLTLPQVVPSDRSNGVAGLQAMNEISSAALLGASVTAMLVGHSYLISPALSLKPLMRMLVALFVSIGVRVVVAACAFVFWMSSPESSDGSVEIWLWLPVRWLVGLVAPLIFGLMAYSAAKIRSTQSATGILYVSTVCTILGELVGVLLARQTGLPL